MNKGKVLERNPNGIYVNRNRGSHLSVIHAVVSFFERKEVALSVLLLCAASDGILFYSVLSMLTYDRPIMLVFQLISLLIAFDVAPALAGIQHKRINLQLTKRRFPIYICLVCVLFFQQLRL